MSKIKTTVRIGGKEYTMSGNDSEEYIHRVAIYVDRKMSQVEESNNQVESYRKQLEALMRQQEANATEMNRLQKENILLREARQGAAPPRRG